MLRALQALAAAAAVLLLAFGMGPLWRSVHRARLPGGWLLLRPPHEVSALLVEGDVVWAGGNDGLFRLDRATGDRLPADPGTRSLRQVRALLLDHDSNLWAAHGAGIEVRRAGRWSRVPASAGMWTALLRRQNGAIWAGGEAGLARLQPGAARIEKTIAQLAIGPVTLLFEDRQARLWAASNSTTAGGVVHVGDDGAVHRPAWLSRLPHPSVNTMLEDRDGALWIGTGFGRQGGVLRIHDGALSVLSKADNLPGEMIRTLWQDRLGRIWVGTEYDGAVYPTPAGWHLLTPDAGLAGWEVKAIAEDRDAQLWLGTENGVTRMPFPGATP